MHLVHRVANPESVGQKQVQDKNPQRSGTATPRDLSGTGSDAGKKRTPAGSGRQTPVESARGIGSGALPTVKEEGALVGKEKNSRRNVMHLAYNDIV